MFVAWVSRPRLHVFRNMNSLFSCPEQTTKLCFMIASTFAPLLVELGFLKSSNEAKKNGWNKPLTKGDFFFKKKTYILA